MNADQITTLLLDADDDMVRHISRLAVNPAYEFENALLYGSPMVKHFPSRDNWDFDLDVEIKPPVTAGGSLRQVIVKWKRHDPSKHLAADKDKGGGYGSYKAVDHKAVAAALANLVKAAHATCISSYHIQRVYWSLEGLQWRSSKPTRRRRA